MSTLDFKRKQIVGRGIPVPATTSIPTASSRLAFSRK